LGLLFGAGNAGGAVSGGGGVSVSGTNLNQWSSIPTNEMASIYYVESNALPVFPNVARQMLNSKPLRFGWLGDSIGSLMMEELVASVASYHGRNGAAVNGGVYLFQTLGAAATNVTRLTNWFAQYVDVGTGGDVTYSNFTGFPYIWSDRFGCEFLFQTNGGTFKMQLATNGGAFADVLTGIATGTASTNLGGVTNVAMLPGYYAARIVQTAGGLVSIIGVDLWSTNGPGVRVSYLNQSATTMQDMAGVPSSISEPILRHLGLDLLTLEGTVDPTVDVLTAVSNLNRRSFLTLTNTDILFVGTKPVDPVNNFDYVTFNAAYRKVAADNNRFFIDLSIVSGTFSNMQAMGWSGDGLHGSNNLHRLCASAVMQKAKLFDTTMDNEGRLMSRTNMFNGPLYVSNNLAVFGPNSSFTIYDRSSPIPVPPAPGALPFGLRLRGENNGGTISFMSSSGAEFGSMRFGGFGNAPYPFTMGDSFGDPRVPWKVYATNGVDMGVGGFTNNYELGLWTIAGAGNGNTNYTLLASKGAMFLGSSNVNISAVMETPALLQRSFTAYVTNLSADTWGFQVSSVTNRWRWWGLNGGGTNAPTVLTNNTMLVVEGKCRGTNIVATYYYVRPGL